MLKRIPTRKRYADLVAACELARLGFQYSDTIVAPGFRGVGPLVKLKAGWKMWRWPEAIDIRERAAILRAFAQRLHSHFPPAHGSKAVATLPLSTGPYHFDTVERALKAADLVASTFGAIAMVVRAPSFRGGERPLMGDYAPSIRINPDWSAGPGSDFFFNHFLPALYRCDDVRRLRECPVCTRPFVALRKDRRACSAPCLNTHRQREHRRRSTVYEQHRKENQKRLAKRRR